MEKKASRRKILAGIAIVGTLFGASLYVPIIVNKALEIGVAGGSIQYDTGLIYDPWISTEVVRWFYVAVVVSPCFIVMQSGFRVFGVLLAASLAVSYLFYDYAFISVWCFFAAIISLFIVYLVHKRAKEVERAG